LWRLLAKLAVVSIMLRMEKSGENSATSVKRAVIISLLAMNVNKAHPKARP
jgi:hypothetical protein